MTHRLASDKVISTISVWMAMACAASVSAVAHGWPESPVAGGSSSLGGGSPASRFCLKIGGKLLESKISDRDGLLFCNIDGASIEEWTLLRSARPGHEPEEAVAHFLAGGNNPNPERACEEKQGRIMTSAPTASSASFRVCLFRDDTFIELSTLARGPQTSETRRMARALRMQRGEVPRRIVMNPKASRKLFDALRRTVPAESSQGSVALYADAITCTKIIVPGEPVQCTLKSQSGASYSLQPSDAAAVFAALDGTLAPDSPMLGARTISTLDLRCALATRSGAEPSCSVPTW